MDFAFIVQNCVYHVLKLKVNLVYHAFLQQNQCKSTRKIKHAFNAIMDIMVKVKPASNVMKVAWSALVRRIDNALLVKKTMNLVNS